MQLLSCGSGYPVLFIHGIPTSNRLWSPVIERLFGRFTCHAVDLPGLGKTPSVPYGPNHLQSLAENIEELRIQKGIEKWHVVGHDAGSVIAVHYAYLFQQRVDCLALLSPALFPELRPYYLFELMRQPLLGELLAPLVNLIFWNVAMRRAFENKEEDLVRALDDFHSPFAGFFGAWRLMRLLRWGKPSEVLAAVPDFLPQLTVPTLIFHGSRDPAIPETFARRASALIPNSEFIAVDSGHFIPLNRPEFVASALLRFFDEHCREFPIEHNRIDEIRRAHAAHRD